MPDINKNIVITPSTNTTNLPNVVFTGGDNVATTLNVLGDGSLQFVHGAASAETIIKTAVTKALGTATDNVFVITDSADAPLFEVRQNGDTVIAGVLTVNGTGTSTFAGDVSIGGSLTVAKNATVNADFTGNNLTLTGNLIVKGNTTLGDAGTDTVSFVGGIVSNFTPTATSTYDLGTTDNRWKNIYVDNAIITNPTFGDGGGGGGDSIFASDILPSENHRWNIGSPSLYFKDGYVSTVHSNDIYIKTDGKFDDVGAADLRVFSIFDNTPLVEGTSEPLELFSVRQNGDTVIGGVLTVNGTGTSTFKGSVNIGGNLYVDGTITGGSEVHLGENVEIVGNLLVKGNTTLGDEATDVLTLVGKVGSSIIPASTGYDLGSASNHWDEIYVDYAHITNFSIGTPGEGGGFTGDIIPAEDDLYSLGSTTKRFKAGHISNIYTNEFRMITDGSKTGLNAATTEVFGVYDNDGVDPKQLFQIMQNGDTIIGGVLTVNGTGTSHFAGNVSIGGSLSVAENATVTADFAADNMTLTGNLIVKGNTTLGDQGTDTISVVGVVNSNVIPAADATQNLGSATNRWNDVYVGGTLYSDDITATTVTIAGNLTVTGTTTYLNTETLTVADNIIRLNTNLADDATPALNAGIEVNRGAEVDVSLIWDETQNLWTVGEQDFKARKFIGTFEGGLGGDITADMDARYVNTAGDTMSGSLTVNGVLSAISKSFVIDHPTKPGLKLRYGSLEGPENGVYVRGQLVGGTEIVLPDYWTGLVDASTMTVNLTANGKFQPLYVVSTAIDKVVVAADGVAVADIDCFYTIFAERKDVAKLVVEYQEVG